MPQPSPKPEIRVTKLVCADCLTEIQGRCSSRCELVMLSMAERIKRRKVLKRIFRLTLESEEIL